MDYYLKAASEAALMTALEAAGVVKSYAVKNEQGETVATRFAPTPGYSLDVIGVIQKPTGNLVQRTVGEITMEVPEMTTLPGFHANLRGPADLLEKTEYEYYTPTEEDLANSEFVMPAPTVKSTTPSPIEQLLVYPQSPSRVWF